MTQNPTKEEECDETILWRRVAVNPVSRHKIETQKKEKWREDPKEEMWIFQLEDILVLTCTNGWSQKQIKEGKTRKLEQKRLKLPSREDHWQENEDQRWNLDTKHLLKNS